MAGDNFEKLLKLGSGSYGSAWLVSNKSICDKHLVLKEIKLEGLSEKQINQALTEVDVLARCKHEHIITYCKAFFNKKFSVLSIVMEYASFGDLHKQITQRRGLFFSDETILRWFAQLTSALDYIHTRCILHRDVKPQNLFLSSLQNLKLGDFGIARVFTNPTDKACTLIGTPFYLSPEVCREEPYSYASDMWAAGCVLYEMCCLCVPFTASNMGALAAKIELANYKPLPSHYGEVLHVLVKSLLTPDPKKRLSAKEIVKMDMPHNHVSTDEKNERREWKRKGQFLSEGEREKKIAKNIDSTTYTVVKHPNLNRPSLASPELSAMIQKQRTHSSLGLVMSADAVRPLKRPHCRKEKKSSSPCFNLFQSECVDQSPPKIEKDLRDVSSEGGCQLEWDKLSQNLYKSYSTSSAVHQPQTASTIQNSLVDLLGLEVFECLLTAVRKKIEFEELKKMSGFSTNVLYLLLLFVQLTDS